MSKDITTAQAFATSWNNLPEGSVYTHDQFTDWLLPLTSKNAENKTVLELGCGNASLLLHFTKWNPSYIEGVDLGESILSATKNLNASGFKNFKITKCDLTIFTSNGFDLVYCIGVLHHLKIPKAGLDAVIANTKKGGNFHCWVYAKEGNAIIIYFVDPLRKIVSKLPWWFTKYLVATPLAVPFYLYAKIIASLKNTGIVKKFPLYEYSLWIAKREFSFFRHVAFDQLVTPQTVYISKPTIEKWLKEYHEIDLASVYIIFRNGNSWKFGGKKI